MAEVLFVEAFYDKEVRLSKEALNVLSKYKTLALFSSVQFIHLDAVKRQLKTAGIKVIMTKAKRATLEGQILGCDCFEDSFKDKSVFKADALLYIGDGNFHPKALLLAQKDMKNKKEVIAFNPLSNYMRIMTYADVEMQDKKYKTNMLKYMHARKVGILVSMKPGQQQLSEALKLKERGKGKKEFYIFLANAIMMNELENFNFIEAWVNTACPRIGFDDILNAEKAVINIKDALEIENANAK